MNLYTNLGILCECVNHIKLFNQLLIKNRESIIFIFNFNFKNFTQFLRNNAQKQRTYKNYKENTPSISRGNNYSVI